MASGLKHPAETKGVKAGLLLGFAAPLMFLGSLPPYQLPRADNVERAWRTVGGTMASVMKREKVGLRGKRS